VAVTPQLLRDWALPEPDDDGGKHERGSVLVLGGASSTPGACCSPVWPRSAWARPAAGGHRPQHRASRSGVALPEAQVVGLPAGPGGSLSPSCADDVWSSREADALVVGRACWARTSVQGVLEACSPAGRRAASLDAVALTAPPARSAGGLGGAWC
jgi:hypothetical protein